MIDTNTTRGIRAAQAGLVTNITLVLVKLLAGIFGNTYALIADAVESSTDIFSSLIVWGGLSVAATPPDKEHPFRPRQGRGHRGGQRVTDAHSRGRRHRRRRDPRDYYPARDDGAVDPRR